MGKEVQDKISSILNMEGFIASPLPMSKFVYNFFRSICAAFVILIGGMIQLKAATIPHPLPINCDVISNENIKFNDRFLEFMQTWQVPGASIAVMKNNKMLLSCGYGWANVEQKQPVMPNALFRLGSVSKTITALTVLKLIQQNKLNFDDKVFHILSNLKPLNNVKPCPEIYNITIRNLLQMSSGWFTDRPNDAEPMFGPWTAEMLHQLNNQTPPDCEMASRLMMGIPLQFTPGTQYSYSNLNYCLLGLVINQVTQQNGAGGYESFVKQNLLSPLGIQDMQIGSTYNKASNEVSYYANNNDGAIDGLPYSSSEVLKKNYADGGWVASAADLVKILQTFYDNQILTPELKKIMISRPQYSTKKSGYPAMGWDEVKSINGKRYISKIGSFTGTKTFILQSSDGVSYAILFNTKPPHGDQFIISLKAVLALINTRDG